MRWASLVLLFVMSSACVGQVSVPSPSPAVPSASPAPTASATPSARPTERQVRPFSRLVTVALPDAALVAVDTERVVFTPAGTTASSLEVVDVATGLRSSVYAAPTGWSIELSSRGLRGDTLVFTERRFEGGRTDGRVVRVDLRTKAAAVLDEWTGPFLGGGDVWNPEPAITNGSEVLWIRITDERRPFAVDLVLAQASGSLQILRSSASATWADLDDSGRVAVSTLISAADRAELELWAKDRFTSLATRPSADGGPVRFVGDRLIWAVGSGIVARIARVQLVSVDRTVWDLDTGACFWRGVAGRHVMLGCGAGAASTQVLLDPATGTRGDEVNTFNQTGAPRAALWREGTQWWLGTLTP